MAYVQLVILLALLEYLLFGHAGFVLSAIPNVALLIGALIGTVRAALLA